MTTLREGFDFIYNNGIIKKEVPEYLSKNLNPNFPLRDYQKEAFVRFSYYLDNWEKRALPTRLLFQMATGSGKTLVMAAQILYLYEKGYRNFIFFVNSTNIIEKTKNNFLNPLSSKYLFAEKLKLNEKMVEIKAVENFEANGKNEISILFTTIQGLHMNLNTPRENSILFEDFKGKKFVLISDEAHHINTMTKNKLTKEEDIELKSWEYTVNKILDMDEKNLLLEFTATANLDNQEIKKKYEDKLIFDYPLKQFRHDKYSKDVEVIKSDTLPLDRSLQALIISQYRRKVAGKHNIQLKPVILMKSKRIEESKQFETQFISMIKNMDTQKLDKIKSADAVKKAFDYFKSNGITLENLVREIKEDFGEDKCISVNSKEESEEKQIIVNTLEDKANQIRVIFAVDKLNEGWDVLNLFDIVRLYDTRDSGVTTTREAQLIGRGARYFPFSVQNSSDKYIRKFDHEKDNELRILEELNYHSPNIPKYIQELRQALIETGIIPKETKSIQVKVKDSFKQTKFYKEGKILLNKKIKNDRTRIYDLKSLGINTLYKHELKTGKSQKYAIFEERDNKTIEKEQKTYQLLNLGKNVIQKAINTNEFYTFENISKYLPNLLSIREFIESEQYLSNIQIDVTGTSEQVKDIGSSNKLEVAIAVFNKIEKEIRSKATEYKGTKFAVQSISEVLEDKTLNISIDESGEQEFGIGMGKTTNPDLHLDLNKRDWYVYDENYGTSEEKYLVRFINSAIERLHSKYSDVYLIRNEKLFQIYRFADGAALEPDFILFLKEKSNKKGMLYQLFVESKGGHLFKTDEWKQQFLLSINEEFKLKSLHEDEYMRLIGMPFYNESRKTEFRDKFNDMLKIGLNE